MIVVEVLGIIFLVLLAVLVLVLIGFTVASVSDLQRYLRIRRM